MTPTPLSGLPDLSGPPDLSGLGRVLAIGPHLDDAVLSAGSFLAANPGALVTTVFAGCPAEYPELTEWDADCGFESGDDVVASRRVEDTRALARLGAQARWLDFLDDQYDSVRPSPESIAEAILAAVGDGEFDAIAFPLGIEHPDHQLTHRACRVLLDKQFGLARHWIAWADVPYRSRFPELFGECLESMGAAGFLLDPRLVEIDARKRDAVGEYPSQVLGLGAASIDDADRAEQLYIVRPQ